MVNGLILRLMRSQLYETVSATVLRDGMVLPHGQNPVDKSPNYIISPQINDESLEPRGY